MNALLALPFLTRVLLALGVAAVISYLATPFVKKLRKFSKVNLKPGEKKTVNFILDDEDFTYIDENMKTAKNSGEHKIIIEDLECTVNI